MSEAELYSILHEYLALSTPNKLNEPAREAYKKLTKYISYLQKENQQQKEEIQELKKKYEKSLELLIEYNLPCEIDSFNTKEENLEYCFKNCSVDERIYIKCWNRFIEQELEKLVKVV